MTHGVEAIVELISDEDLSYPLSIRTLEDQFALENIDIDENGNSIMLVEILAEAETDRFVDQDELVQTLEPLLEAEREERRPGLLGRIKRFFLHRQ